jgi:FdhD protein
MISGAVAVQVWRGGWQAGTRDVAPEVPVALVYDGGTEAVMMASPSDLEDFGIGFSCTERIVASAAEIADIQVVAVEYGMEVRMFLSGAQRERLIDRRRLRAGPSGCGLCGIESLAEAVAPLPVSASDVRVTPEEVIAAMRALSPLQVLNRSTSAMHAAALFRPGEGIIAVREDVGRHNALDKLQGALVRSGRTARDGVILMTSRISIELVQKAAVMGASVLAAISAPTSLAIEQARRCGLTLVGIVRPDGLELFAGEERLRHAP